MTAEDDIKQKLTSKFDFLADKVAVKRERRIFLDVDMANFRKVLRYAIEDLSFTNLCTITGLDETERFGLIYHLSRDQGIMLNIRTNISRTDPVLETLTDIFPNADIYERELADLFGINVKGLPQGDRYPLPDDWPKGIYPLRKDFNKDQLDKKENA